MKFNFCIVIDKPILLFASHLKIDMVNYHWKEVSLFLLFHSHEQSKLVFGLIIFIIHFPSSFVLIFMAHLELNFFFLALLVECWLGRYSFSAVQWRACLTQRLGSHALQVHFSLFLLIGYIWQYREVYV